MKYTIAAADYAKLAEPVKAEYKEGEGGSYVLNLEGHEDHFVPKGKKDEAEKHRKRAEDKVAELEAREAKLIKDLEAAAGNKTEVEAIRKQHQAEVEKIKNEYAEKEKAAKAETHKAMIAAEATRFAGEKFTVPSAIARLYQDRLAVEEVDGVPVIRVREPDGKPSVKSLADLQTEFLANKEFAPIVKASSGSGGGAARSDSKGGGAAQRIIPKGEFEAMSQEERHQALVVEKARVSDQ
jgi:hypothetical protein